MKLYIDAREKDDSLIATIIERCVEEGEEWEIKQLAVGDYLWEGKNADGEEIQVCIEHKTVKDLTASKASAHLETQLADLRQFPNYLLLIDGKFDFRQARYGVFYSPKLKNGLLTSIALRDRVPYVHVEYRHELVDVLFMCRDAGIKGERTEIIERHSKTLSRKDASLYMWHCVPGIGESRARELNKIVRFGPFVKSCMTVGVDITMEERGIPKKLLPKKARAFLEEM